MIFYRNGGKIIISIDEDENLGTRIIISEMLIYLDGTLSPRVIPI